jgi:ADP-ribosyl-[dinitrogen reductase] hydrolase
MTGHGPFSLNPGEWTDDTSMALCLATSLLECQGFDPRDQMERYLRWWSQGYLSSNGRCFDIGTTCRSALSHYKATGEPYSGSPDPYSAGNGSIMRLAPVPMFFYPDHDAILHYSVESSRTTHAAVTCLDACCLLGDILYRALDGLDKDAVLFESPVEMLKTPAIQSIALGEYSRKALSQVRGTGYVVDSLEAALWSFWITDNFEQAILTAANLGDDADTTAAICGQVAGAFYGQDGIPAHWLAKLVMQAEISNLAARLCRR